MGRGDALLASGRRLDGVHGVGTHGITEATVALGEMSGRLTAFIGDDLFEVWVSTVRDVRASVEDKLVNVVKANLINDALSEADLQKVVEDALMAEGESRMK